MTFKIETSQFYDYNEPKQWKWNKKSDIFSWDMLKSDIIFHWPQNTKLFQWLFAQTSKVKWN